MKAKVLFILLACCFITGLAFAGPAATETAPTEVEDTALMPEVEAGVELSTESCANFEERSIAEILAPEQFVLADYGSCVTSCRLEQRACMLGCIVGGVVNQHCVDNCMHEWDWCKGRCQNEYPI